MSASLAVRSDDSSTCAATHFCQNLHSCGTHHWRGQLHGTCSSARQLAAPQMCTAAQEWLIQPCRVSCAASHKQHSMAHVCARDVHVAHRCIMQVAQGPGHVQRHLLTPAQHGSCSCMLSHVSCIRATQCWPRDTSRLHEGLPDDGQHAVQLAASTQLQQCWMRSQCTDELHVSSSEEWPTVCATGAWQPALGH